MENNNCTMKKIVRRIDLGFVGKSEESNKKNKREKKIIKKNGFEN